MKTRPRKLEMVRVRRACDKADRLGLGHSLTLEEWMEIRAEYSDLCAYCFAPFQHLEHIIELSTPGSPGTVRSNVVPACAECNYKKHRGALVPHLSSRFWPPTEAMLRSTCPQGHPWDGNAGVVVGNRRCLACHRANAQKKRDELKLAAA